MAKRTYSQRDKHRSAYEHHRLPDDDDSRKRHKVDDPNELHLHSPPPSRGEKTSSLLKKGLKVFGGPISIPDDDMEIEVEYAPKSRKRLTVLDKALKERCQAVKPKQPNIYGSREDFVETMKEGKKWKQHDPMPRNSYLPTPPAEIQKTHQQARRAVVFPNMNGVPAKFVRNSEISSDAPTETSRLFEKIITDELPKKPYEPKVYTAEKIPAPRKTILGDRLPRRSREAQSWSTNQSNSPLLCLPAYVRNLIYEYALGGNTISIGYETYRTTYKSNKPHTVVPIFKYHCTVFDKQTNPFKAMQPPYVNISTGFSTLHNICRQMYLETATLPFKLNLMSFSSHNVMFNMLFLEKRLSRQQLDAITRLALSDALPQPNMLTHLRYLKMVYLSHDQENGSKGWHRVVRCEGEEPELVDSRYGR